MVCCVCFFFKQKTADEMRISDWSSDVCSSDLPDLVFTESDLDILCKEADVIVTFLTKVAYLGLANRKPVVSFSGGLLARLGVTYEVKSESDLNALLRRALQRKDLNVKLDRKSTRLNSSH